ncbi:hypothetical protein Tco_0596966 [Tanacetum coccineum]
MELVLEQTQQGTSHEVLVSTEGVEELKRIVRIKGEKKEAIHILRQKPVDIEKVAVSSRLRRLKPKCTIESRAKRSSINLVRAVRKRIILRVLRGILVILPEHPSDTKVFTVKMEIRLKPTSNKL